MKTISIALSVVAAVALFRCGGATSEDPGDAGSDGGNTDAAIVGFSDCVTLDDCVGTSEGCCPGSMDPSGQGCGPVTLAVNKNKRAEFNSKSCGRTDVACTEACMIPSPSLRVACVTNKCTLVDIAKEPVTECGKKEDCVLRLRGCCTDCGPQTQEAAIAIRADKTTEYEALVCGREVQCSGAPCQSPPPVKTFEAACIGGRCTVAPIALE